jgi:GTP-binding protein
LGVLIENMRREGYELAVSRPQVVVRVVDGERQEPWEQVTLDIEERSAGRRDAGLGRAGWSDDRT